MKMMKFQRAMAIGLLLTMTAAGLASAETVMAVKKAKVYQKPSAKAASVKVSAGTTMEVTGEKDGWLRVERDGKTAYLREDDVIEIKDCDEATAYAAESAPLYKAYGKTAKHGTLPEGAKVTVYFTAGKWARVGYRDYKGYVRKDALTTEKPAVKEEAVEEEKKEETIDMNGKAAYAVAGAKVYKKASTSSKQLATLSLNTRLSMEAVRGDWAAVTLNGAKGFMKLSDLMDEKEKVEESKETVSAQGRAVEMDWWTSDIQQIFARDTVATITDVATGISWKEVRKGGTNHADTQPLTAADTAAMKKACGSWSWDRRAIFVTIDGVNYAASMNSMPHGGGSISNNNYDGHHCIHFTNSRTHGTDKVCPDHQAAVKKAAKAKL